MLKLKPLEPNTTSEAGGFQLLNRVLSHPCLIEVFEKLSREGFTPAVFGGAIRDTILLSEEPKDIDVVVAGGISIAHLESIVESTAWMEKTKTSYDTPRFRFAQPFWQLDIFPLEKVWAVEQGFAASLQQLPSTTIFNTEAVLYLPIEKWFLTGNEWDLTSGRGCDSFNVALEERVIEFNSSRLPPKTQLYLKDLVAKRSRKFFDAGFKPGPKLRDYIYANYYSCSSQ